MTKQRKVDYLTIKGNKVFYHTKKHNDKLLFEIKGTIRDWGFYGSFKSKSGLFTGSIFERGVHPYLDALVEWPLSNWYEKEESRIDYNVDILHLFLLVEENGKDILYRTTSFDGEHFSELGKLIEADGIEFKMKKSRRGVDYLLVKYLTNGEEKEKMIYL